MERKEIKGPRERRGLSSEDNDEGVNKEGRAAKKESTEGESEAVKKSAQIEKLIVCKLRKGRK